MKNTNMSNKIDFIGIGAPKCGSTWVGKCLEEHPEINFAKVKEVNFFNENFSNLKVGRYFVNEDNYNEKGWEWYFKQFPTDKLGKIRGEFSVTYLSSKQAPKRIKKHFPDVKILVTLRNPVDMIYSNYWFCKPAIHGTRTGTFKSYIKNHDVLKIALYYQHLKIFYDLFSSKNIHIILLDDLKKKPHEVVKELYRFLDVSEDFNPSILTQKVNSSFAIRSEILRTLASWIFIILYKILPRSLYNYLRGNPTLFAVYLKLNTKKAKYPPMQAKEAEYLKNYYKEDIKKLEKLIQKDLSGWYK